jgi:hypothetical protein
MEPNNQNQVPQQEVPQTNEVNNEPAPNLETENPIFKEKESRVGPVIGSIIVIIVIIVGGLYFWSTLIEDKQEQIEDQSSTEEQTTENDGRVSGVPQRTSGSAEASSVSEIESELNSDDLNSLDTEIEEIDSEYDGA